MSGSDFMADATPGTSRRIWAVWLLSTIAIAILIGVLTLTPTAPVPRSHLPWDKAAHAIAFMVLVFPTAALWPRVTAWIGLAAVLYGGAIEVIQPYAGRSAELADLFADAVGVVLGIILGLGLRRVRAYRRARRGT